MRTVTAGTNQTLFDIALQEMGSIEGVFELLAANPSLALDANIAPLTELNIPGAIINRQVTDYYSKNNIKPATGIEEEVIITEHVEIHQALNYDLSTEGYVEFDPVELTDFSGTLNIDVIIEGSIEEDTVEFWMEYLDGIYMMNDESHRYLTGSYHMTLNDHVGSTMRGIIWVYTAQQATLREIVYSYEKPI